ncbi:MAG: hypothetical protein D8M59_14100 [Planctomycetes bacterium]|nr:hypothetical protein [Planctomycetota bacterium]NOG55640.1 hypothetical protein [Planctomycetota bacterium]
MEFIEYQAVLPGLRDQGITEVEDDQGRIRLEADPSPTLQVLHFKSETSTTPPYPDARILDRAKENLPAEIIEILGRLHLNEVIVVPVCEWQGVIVCAAYDLANDETWIEFDAVAALHQKTRDPLAVTRGEFSVLQVMIKAILENGESPAQDLIITSDLIPLLIEVFPDGTVSVTCRQDVADELVRNL